MLLVGVTLVGPVILFKDTISPHVYFDLLTSLEPIYLKYHGFEPNILQNPTKLLIFMIKENYFLYPSL